MFKGESMRQEMASDQNHKFCIGYNLAWRITFLIFAVFMLGASVVMLALSIIGGTEGLFIPTSVLIAACFMSAYLVPLITTRQQQLEITVEGLKLTGDRSSVVLPWTAVTGAHCKRVMLVMPYLTISLADKEQLAHFFDENPRSFLAKWTSHVAVFRWYPWALRWLFSVPKKITTLAVLDWLERRYGGAIVIDAAAVNGRRREIERAVRSNLRARSRASTKTNVPFYSAISQNAHPRLKED
jgi:hypothetical protein